MNVAYQEKIAIIFSISAVAFADDEFTKDESLLRSKIAIFLGLTNADNVAVQSMDLEEACRIMSLMPYENKRFASAVLTQMMMADGVDLYIEHNVIDFISQNANLPFISPNEAYVYLKNIGIIGNKLQNIWGILKNGAY